MKKLIWLIALATAPLFAADTVLLRPGDNATTTAQVLAFEAVTASATPALKVQYVRSVTETTNATARNVSRHVRYDFGLTNWNGSAYVSTNTFDRFVYSDWTVLGTNHVAGAVASTNVVVTNSFTIAVPGRTFFVTNSLFSASAVNHYLMATNPAIPYVTSSGRLILTGAAAGDSCWLIVK